MLGSLPKLIIGNVKASKYANQSSDADKLYQGQYNEGRFKLFHKIILCLSKNIPKEYIYVYFSYFIDDESEFIDINKIAATGKKYINSTFLIYVDAYLQYGESYFILLNIFGGNICRK